VYRLRMSQTLDIRVFRELCVSCIKVFCDVEYSLKIVIYDTKSCFVSVLVGWHFSGAGSIFASAAPNPIATRPTFPKMFDRSPDESDHCRKCSDCHSYSENGRMCIG